MGAANYINQLITKSKKHIDNNTIIVGDFNTPLNEMDRSSKQKINKEIKALNDTLDQMDIKDIFRTFHPKATEYTFFSGAPGTFSRIDHILGPKSGLNWYQKIGIIPCIFSDHNALKLELNQKRKLGKNPNAWRLNSILPKNEWVNQEIKEELKNFMETNDNENTMVQNLWDTAKAVLRGKYIVVQAFLKKQERSQVHNLILYLKELEKEQERNPK